MSSKPTEPRKVSKAELKFREAFERLRAGKSDILPKGTPLSQNNVVKEAGVDPHNSISTHKTLYEFKNDGMLFYQYGYSPLEAQP